MRINYSIRTSLLAVVSLLCFSVIVLSGLQVAGAWKKLSEAGDVADSNQTADLLLSSAGDWAVERGVTNAALAGNDPATADTIKAIQTRRDNADSALDLALQRLDVAPDFKDRAAIVAEVKAALAKVVALRTEADTALGQPLSDRNPDLSARWVPTSTALIMASRRLRLASQYLPETIESRID